MAYIGNEPGVTNFIFGVDRFNGSGACTQFTLTRTIDDANTVEVLVNSIQQDPINSYSVSGGVITFTEAPSSGANNIVVFYRATSVISLTNVTTAQIADGAVTLSKMAAGVILPVAANGATIIAANSTTDALRITQTGTGKALLVEDSANPDATPFVIDASGRAIVGYTESIAGAAGTIGLVQAIGTSSPTIAVQSWTATSAAPARIEMARSASATIGTRGVVSAEADIGRIRFTADDGTAFIEAAAILAEVDGTPGTNDMPGRLMFSTTADGASSPTERMRIGSTGTISLGAAPGSESLRVTPVASAVNYFQVNGGATTASPYLSAQGSDANIHSQYLSKGTYGHIFNTGSAGNYQFYVAHTASAVNYLQVTGGGTGTGARLFAAGSDANVSLDYVTKGTSSHVFYTGTSSAAQFVVANIASAVNYLQVKGGATGNATTLSAQGSDTNIDLALTPKGTGGVGIGVTPSISGAKLTTVGGPVQLSPGTTSQEGIRFTRASGICQINGINNDNNAYNALAFATGASEAMRIDSSGNLLVGATSVYANAKVTFDSKTASYPALAAFKTVTGDTGTPGIVVSKFDNVATTSQVLVQFLYNNGSNGLGQINGNGGSQAAFGSYSDARLKENITDLPTQLEKICALRPVEFDYKDGSGHQIGFIAQEIQEVYPDAVGVGHNEMLTVTGWNKTEAYLVKAIQELKAEFDAYKATHP